MSTKDNQVYEDIYDTKKEQHKQQTIETFKGTTDSKCNLKQWLFCSKI